MPVQSTGAAGHPVAHAYNPSYSGGRELEDCGSKLDWANTSKDPILKILNTKNRVEEWLKWYNACLAGMRS
jgi:hypothetical protein